MAFKVRVIIKFFFGNEFIARCFSAGVSWVAIKEKVVYDLQPINIVLWPKGHKCPGIFVLGISTIPIRQLAD
jgi:hypothetical protein